MPLLSNATNVGSSIFTIWVQSAYNGTATSCGTSSGSTVWTAWNVGGSSTSASITGTVTTSGTIIWQNWNEVLAAHGHRIVQAEAPAYQRAQHRPPSPEERARREAETAAYEARLAEERKFRLEAEAKAELLLQRLLTEEQRDSLKEKRCFYLHSKGKKYRIDRGQHGNVKLLDAKDEVIESYCIQPRGGLPDADAMAAQKLLLETDPEMFARVANITRRDGGRIRGREAAAVG